MQIAQTSRPPQRNISPDLASDFQIPSPMLNIKRMNSCLSEGLGPAFVGADRMVDHDLPLAMHQVSHDVNSDGMKSLVENAFATASQQKYVEEPKTGKRKRQVKAVKKTLKKQEART